MIEKLDTKSFLENYDWPIIDVRSPAEFEYAHIPGAYNIPLLEGTSPILRGSMRVALSSAIPSALKIASR